jgi:phenylpropionate dioxygenase-like ring-hydroxylating dioxygenase large terminal subunit
MSAPCKVEEARVTLAPRVERDWSHLVQPDRIHQSLYTDPALFPHEMTKLFGGLWTYLCHESELPAANAFKRVRLGLRPVVMTRDKGGAIHGLFNRCAHRAATICQEDAGAAARFTCPYHGWTYANDGRLIGVPFDEGYGDAFDKSLHGLRRIPRIETYRGFVFGTLNPDMPSLTDHLGAATELIDEFIGRAPGGEIMLGAGSFRGVFGGNWKLVFDNAADGYHPAFSHRSIMDMTRIRNGGDKGGRHFATNPDTSPMYCKAYPNGHGLLHQRPGMGNSLWDRVRPTPGSEAQVTSLITRLGEDGARAALEGVPGGGINLNIFPNLLLIGNQVQVVEPLAHDRTQLTWYATTLKGAEPEVNQLRMRVAEDFPILGETDDLEMFERCWEGMRAEEAEWVLCGRGSHRADADTLDPATGVRTVPPTDEAPMRNFYRHYANVMSGETKLVVA